MPQTIAITLTTDASQVDNQVKEIGTTVDKATTSVKSFKSQLKEAKQDLYAAVQTFGEFSDEAIKAGEKVGELNNTMQDANKLAKNFATDGSASFAAFGGAIKGIAGGFAAAQGAMALFGDQSKDVQETLAKVQGALALSEGVNAIVDAQKAFAGLGAVVKASTVYQTLYNFVMNGSVAATAAATTAINAQVPVIEAQADVTQQATISTTEQAVAEDAQAASTVVATTATGGLITSMGALRIALIATGIGAIVILLVAAYVAISNWASANEKALQTQRDLADATKSLNEVLIQQNDILAAAQSEVTTDLQNQISLLQKKGATQEQLLPLQKKLAQQEADNARDQLKNLGLTESKIEEYGGKIRSLLASKEAAQNGYNKAIIDGDKDLAAANKQVVDDFQKQIDALQPLYNKGIALQHQIVTANQKSNEEQASADADTLDKHKKHLSDRLQADLDASKNKEELNKNSSIEANENENHQFIIAYQAQQSRIKLLQDYATQAKSIGGEYYDAAKKQLQEGENALTVLQSSEELKRYNDLKKNFEDRKALLKADNGFGTAGVVNANQLDQLNRDQYNAKFHTGGAINDTSQGAVDSGLKAASENAKAQRDIEQQAANDKLDDQSKQFAEQEQQTQANFEKNLQLAAGNQDAITAAEDIAAEERKKIAKAEHEFKLGLAASFADQAADIVGRQTVAGKAFAIAAAIINTYLGATKALDLPPPFSFIQFGLTIATGLKAVANIVNTQIPGKGTGGAGSAPGGISVPTAPLTPTLPQQTNTTLNQGQLNQIGNATVRAFVVESDISSQQEKITRLNRAARLGG